MLFATIAGLAESALIIVLAIALAVLIIYRRQRGEARRLAEERVQGVVDAAQRQNQEGGGEDRGVFPQRGDPEFMDWAVGGVGN